MTALIAAFVVVSAVMTLLLQRELERVDARRRTRARLAEIRGRFVGLQTGVGVAMLPAIGKAVAAAADFEAALLRLEKAMSADDLADLHQLALRAYEGADLTARAAQSSRLSVLATSLRLACEQTTKREKS